LSNDGGYKFYFLDKTIGLNIMEKTVCGIREAKGSYFSFLCPFSRPPLGIMKYNNGKVEVSDDPRETHPFCHHNVKSYFICRTKGPMRNAVILDLG
jgi:hypothetical protein